jgi:hypothetical protein
MDEMVTRQCLVEFGRRITSTTNYLAIRRQFIHDADCNHRKLRIVEPQNTYRGTGECFFENQSSGIERWSDGRIAVGMWVAALRSYWFEPEQLQSRECHWVIVNLVGKGARLRTVPVPTWSKELVDT